MIDFDREALKQTLTTVYGYDIDDLIIVATMMREQNLSPEDIAQLVRDWRMNLQIIGDLFRKEFEKALNKEFGLEQGDL